MPKRLISAFGVAIILMVALGVNVSAQWPTTCVELNDIVEAHLGNDHNVGIYQSTFGDEAEAACQNDHRGDVQETFAWVNDPSATANESSIKFGEFKWAYLRSDGWIVKGNKGNQIPAFEDGKLVVPDLNDDSFFYWVYFDEELDSDELDPDDYVSLPYTFDVSRDVFTGLLTYSLAQRLRLSGNFPVSELSCEQTADGWELWAWLPSGFSYVYGTSTITFSYHVDGGSVQTEYWLIDEFEINPVAWTYSPDNLIRQTIGANRIVSRFQVGQDTSSPRETHPVFPAPELNFLLEKCGRTYRAPLNLGWPETCVELNDIVENHLGNTGNVGIYQAVFGDQAEQGCQNDHREDVRSVFVWALRT